MMAGTQHQPSFLIIGAQRSASTFLSMCMRRHRKLFLPNGEVEYFEDPVYGRLPPSFLSDLFARAPADRIYGFKRPELLARPECPPRIARALPRVRMIAVLRNPVERTVSAYFHYSQGRGLPLLPLNEGLLRILDGDLADRFPLSRSIIEYSLYGEQLARYRQAFDAESILTLFDHELITDTEATMRRVFDFIGVDPDMVGRFPATKSNVGAYSGPRLRFLRLASPLAYSYKQGSQFGSVRTNPVALAAYKAAWRFDRSVLTAVFGNERPHLDDGVRTRLIEIFRPDARKLRSLIGPIPSDWELS